MVPVESSRAGTFQDRTGGGPAQWECLWLLRSAGDLWSLDNQALEEIERVTLKHLLCEDFVFRREQSAGYSLSNAIRLATQLGAPELYATLKRLAEGDLAAWQKCGRVEPNPDLRLRPDNICRAFAHNSS